LTRTWQMLLKGLSEVRGAPSPLQAAEMVLIRVAYAAELPTPAEALEQLRGRGPTAPPPSPGAGPGPGSGGGGPVRAGSDGTATAAKPVNLPWNAPPEPVAQAGLAAPTSFVELVALLQKRREAVFATHLRRDVHLVRYEIGRIEFRTRPEAPANLPTRLSKLLQEWTGRPWMVSVSHEAGEPTLFEQEADQQIRRQRDAEALPLVQAVLAAFPGAKVEEVRDLTVEADTLDNPVLHDLELAADLEGPDDGDDR
jgi:DNA polymerase III subunit gamma/tau